MSLKITVDPTSATAPFEQLREQIAGQARAGVLPVGYRMPTVRGLAETLGLAANTVAKAYRALESDGVIETRGRHGTFIAGVARCQAPEASVYVANEFSYGGGLREWEVVLALQDVLTRNPQVVNLSAGTYCRNDWPPLSFLAFQAGVTLTCAAGNDATSRAFWPAAFDWTVGVGALGADQRHRAWFSNYGDWVDVYTLGEGLVNAFAAGLYTYHEPPKRPAVQEFRGLARWSGTSFAAPLVAGLIAAQMSAAGMSAADATSTLLSQAEEIPGLGRVLRPRQA